MKQHWLSLFLAVFVASGKLAYGCVQGGVGAQGWALASTTALQQQAVTTVLPEYPKALREAGAGGYVSMYITLGADGEAKTLNFVDGDSRLAEVTLEALRKWRFKPVPGARMVWAGTLEFRFDRETGTVTIGPKIQDILNRVDIPPPPKPESGTR